MGKYSAEAVKFCKQILLDERKYNIEHSILNSEIKIIDRLLIKSLEMAEVYTEIFEKLAGNSLKCLMQTLLSTGAFWHPEANRKAREQRQLLIEINQDIAAKSSELSALIKKRSDLNNQSGFSSNTHYSIGNVVLEASKNNHLFQMYVKDQLTCLLYQFDLKYWPEITDVIDELADNAQSALVEASDPLTQAATATQRSSKADYLKALFVAIDENSAEFGGPIPSNLRLTDKCFATLTNCILDLPVDELIDAQYVKRLRQRIRISDCQY